MILLKGNHKVTTDNERYIKTLKEKGFEEYGEAEQGNTEGQAVETKQAEEVKHVGAGWYELPNGERVRGKEAALKAVKG